MMPFQCFPSGALYHNVFTLIDQPDRKKQKVEKETFEKSRIPFYMTTVKGIDDCFNSPNIALSITGTLFQAFEVEEIFSL